jgi:putative FmdB family regulatory protein
MIYPYKCPDCQHYLEDIRPVSQHDQITLCPKCDQVMARVFTPVAGRMGMIGNRPPPGCVELGNEKPNVTPPKSTYDITRNEINAYPELEALGA